jgi:formylglycine-generating enzyme required for sulfatase activity
MRQLPTRFLFAVLISAIAVAQQVASSGSSPTDILYTHPGQLVSVNGFRLNLYCMGSGSPTVVFDSGWEDWAPSWSKVQPEIAKWTRVCSYDRAGVGFSEPGPMPRTSVRIAQELRTALHRANVAGPYILVGHAFGGDNVRTFADLYMSEVAGLVLIDADSDDVGPKAMQEEQHRGDAGIISQLRNCRNAIAEHKPLPTLPSRPGQPQRTCAQQFFRGLPEAAWSPELNAKLMEIAQTKVAMYDAYLSEMDQTPSDEDYLQKHRRSFGARPVRVLTSGNHGVGHLERKPPDTPEHVKYEQETTLAQAHWLTLSSNSKQIFARNSSEYIQFDEPETVIDAIREIHEQTKPAPSGQKTSATKVGAAFRDCSDCPEMVVIPAGHFMMGSSEAEKAWVASHGGSQAAVADEAPQHEVTLQRFALGKYTITRSEYATFVRETGRSADDGCGRDSFKWDNDPGLSWQAPGFTQSERDPVVCVSWEDAQAYVTWLNGKARPGVGDGAYRLPSEAEWEYAARAGTTTKFWWGDDESQASTYAWYKDNSGERTHPVGEKPANAFHLYDMAGNVWQWTADCYAENYVGAPTDGHPNENGVSDPRPNGTKKCMRVDRGGSWLYPAWLLRPATRERNPANFRDRIMGFRVAKTLP